MFDEWELGDHMQPHRRRVKLEKRRKVLKRRIRKLEMQRIELGTELTHLERELRRKND